MSWIFPKFWSEISDLGSPKDHKLTLKFNASPNDPTKIVFVRKNRLGSCTILLIKESCVHDFVLTPVPKEETEWMEARRGLCSCPPVVADVASLMAWFLKAITKFSASVGGRHSGLVSVKCTRDNSVLPSSA